MYAKPLLLKMYIITVQNGFVCMYVCMTRSGLRATSGWLAGRRGTTACGGTGTWQLATACTVTLLQRNHPTNHTYQGAEAFVE